MLFQHLLLAKMVSPFLAFSLSFFNFLSDSPNINITPPGVCERPAFGSSVITNTLNSGGESATGDFNNDGKLDIAIQYGSQDTLVIYNGKGNGDFGEARVIDSNSTTFSVVAGDFNNDGKTDLLTAARIYYGDGAGNFPQSRLLLLGANATGFTKGDFNGDDNLDIIGYVFSNSTAEIFFGDGAGNFGNRATVSIPTNGIRSFDVSDINADGISDIVVTLSNSNGVAVVLGAPSGFQTPVLYPITGSGALNTLAVGDVDGDGDKDILAYGTVSSSSAFTVLFLNNGNGTLTAQPRVSDPAGDLNLINLFDVNNDGKLDFVGTISRGLLSIRIGNNTGAFEELKLVPVLSGVSRPLFEDFTGDGIRDLLVNSTSVNALGVYINDGSGNFGVEQTSVDNQLINDTAVADFNEDGKPDVVTGSDSRKLWVGFGNGNGLNPALTSVSVSAIPRMIVTGDLNNDNHQDILAFLSESQSKTAIIYGNGNGTFQPAIESGPFTDLSGRGKPKLVYIDGDNYIDLVLPSGANQNRLSLYQNTAQNSFIFRSSIDVGTTVGSVTSGDYNQDGKADLAILSSGVHIYLGNGTYNFTRLNFFPAGQANAHIISTDFNNDGMLDLAATTTQTGANGTPGKVDILMGVGKGGFGAPVEYIVGRGPKWMAAADYDGDGNMDLAVEALVDDRVSILYGDGQGFFPRLLNSVTAVSPRGLEAADFDSDGRPDLITSDFSLGLISLARNICLPAPAVNLPTLSAGADVNVTEGDASNTTANVTVSLNSASAIPVRVKYYTAPLTGIAALQENEFAEAQSARDYNSISGELLFQPGETSKTLQITVRGDLIDEFDEKFAFYLVNGVNAPIARNQTIITIIDNDAPPSLSIGNFGQAEGNTGSTAFNFPVTLSALSEKPVFVQYLTGGGTATPNQDYTRAQGTLTIPAGQLQGTIGVNVTGDLTVEQDETFMVDLSDPLNAIIGSGRGTGTIVNDDNGGTVQFSSATFTTNDSTNGVLVSITRTGGNGGGVSFRFRTQAGTALPGQDYTEVTTNVVLGDNETGRNVFIPVVIDQLDEPDETVNLIIDNPVGVTLGTPSTAILTIQDLEAPPTLTITDSSVIEGNNGTTTTMQFFLLLSRPTQRPVTVSFATVDETATAGEDYQAATGSITIQPGVTRKAIEVIVIGDSQFEQDETFLLNLSNPVNVVLADNQATGRITNDELNPSSRTMLVSINRTNDGSGNSDSQEPSISANGQIIAFESFASNLAGNDTNGFRDVYVRNLENRTTKLVSLNQAGDNSGNCESSKPVVSGNGRFVAFNSCATNLTTGSGQPANSVYVRDLQTDQTRLVSTNAGGAAVNGNATAISADGRFIVYQSRDQNITNVPDTQNFLDIFVRDMQSNVTQLVTVNSSGNGGGNADSGNTDNIQRTVNITSDGRYLIFPSSATNLVSATSSGGINVFVRDLQNQTTVPVSSNPNNTQLLGSNPLGCLSDDGRYAFFVSGFNGYVPVDTNNTADIFRRDLTNNTIALVSFNAAGTASANSNSTLPYCSANGRYVAFETTASDMSSTPDTNTFPDIYWRDVSEGTTKLISVNGSGTNAGNLFSSVRGISADGQTVLFMSAAGDLLDSQVDNNANFDLYLRDLPTSQTKVVSVNEGGTAVGNLPTTNGLISADGKIVAFPSSASNLVFNDTNTVGSDIFAYSKKLPSLPIDDFDGDGKTDIGIFRPSDGSWWYSRSTDSQTRVFPFGTGSDRLTPGDFTGDGKTDIAIFRPATGEWFVQRSEDNSFFSFPFGANGDVPAPADYDGDGKSDAAVFRPSSGTWFILNSGGSGTSIVQFGSPEDKPVTADFDGDGKADIAIFRPSDGSWWYLQSSNAQFKVYRFGVGTDKPVQGDYTGDGKADIAVWRPSTGEWFFQRSEDNSYFSVPFGQSGDVPAPGDYDGDGRFDTAVFRPSTGNWFVQGSTAGILITSFGSNGDRPIPNVFVP
jgi:hypothetical protein